jgi:Tol biopolymer transport system component
MMVPFKCSRLRPATTVLLLCVVMALAGGAAHAVVSPIAVPRDTQPWWAPQGTTLAFQRVSAGLESGGDVLYTPAVRGPEVDIVGAGRVRGFRSGTGDLLVETGSSTSVRDSTDREVGSVPGTDATWSPDGTQIAFLEGDVLAVSAASGANVRQLVKGIAPPGHDLSGPVWSPDGTALAIATASAAGSELEIVPVDGSQATVAFDGAGESANPSWSRDGSTLAFERNERGTWAIWLVAPDGSGAREAIGGSVNNRFPQWSPADGRLAFLSDRGGGYALYIGTPDGPAQELIGAVAPDSPARWSPSGAALAASSARDCRRFGIYVVSSSPRTQPARRSNQCRIDGTPGPDLILGTPYYDLMDGHSGNDSMFAGNGDDVVLGGPGNDALGGGPGNDVIDGGAGDDVLSGSIGNDVIYGGAGHEKIGGGPGNDVIHGGPGRDEINCGPGNDTAYVGPGDTVRGCEHVVPKARRSAP